MKASAYYRFTRKVSSAYLLEEVRGLDVLPLPEYVRKPFTGRRYIKFELNKYDRSDIQIRFPWVFNLGRKPNGSSIRLTGVNFPQENPFKTFGDNRNVGRSDAILIEFSPDREKLEMWLFEKQAGKSEELFRRWIDGSLCLTMESGQPEKKAP